MFLRISFVVRCIVISAVLGSSECRNIIGRAGPMEENEPRRERDTAVGFADNTATNTLVNAIAEIPALDTEPGRKFRTPCKSEDRCNKSVRRLMVPKLAQLENTIMALMKELAAMPPGARLPDKTSKTDPWLLMMDGNYKEPLCEMDPETCAQEDRRRLRILRKLFLKKYGTLRQQLISYGGRKLWGGEANLFYR